MERDARNALMTNGYCVLENVQLDDLRSLAGELGSIRSGWEELTPRPQSEARAGSLSGTYGLGSFPWHTDGAVARKPPRYLVMTGWQSSSCESTEIAMLHLPEFSELRENMARTVLMLRRGRAIAYASALDRRMSDFIARWDSRSALPVDSPSARRTRDLFNRLEPTAEVSWKRGVGAIIDNFRCVHRRPPVKSVDRMIMRLYVYERL